MSPPSYFCHFQGATTKTKRCYILGCHVTTRVHYVHAATHTAYYKRKCSTHSLAANSSANVLL